MTAHDLVPAAEPTLYFIGVTTGRSSIQRVFPRWAAELGIEARLQGVDLPVGAPADDYRRVVEFIGGDPLSRGALVTTHKIDVYRACADLFDEVDAFARMMGEAGCLSKPGERLACHAKDPISSGLALDAFVPAGHWASGAQVACLGAGGSAVAITWYLTRPGAGDVPERVVVTDRAQARLDHIREVHEQAGLTGRFEYVLVSEPGDNDRVVAGLPDGSLVVNATGLGKDAPGSPLTDAAVFPRGGLVWELNYRGDLVFLDQAGRQRGDRGLHVEDGWTYFVHGWTQVIGEVFARPIATSGPEYDRLSELAAEIR
ncbi:shikimate dehydrogenase [Jiangella rhizosphaerae]|uniref:Shikimate dehydrogenase n=2 Tax=Jiangella rhizosphaerae TaxID=2293569 RepID=A0A418KKP4_9ACTN|nr:shikimate dehydrogenase [Jiangella rhizosphaerae]